MANTFLNGITVSNIEILVLQTKTIRPISDKYLKHEQISTSNYILI